jgi:hypothetical protein
VTPGVALTPRRVKVMALGSSLLTKEPCYGVFRLRFGHPARAKTHKMMMLTNGMNKRRHHRSSSLPCLRR